MILQILVGLWISVLAAGATTDLSCHGNRHLNNFDMSPEGIDAWLRENDGKIKTPGDFICCLPEHFRSHYVVAHSSVAAQKGFPEHPRALLYDDSDDGETFNSIITVTSSPAPAARGRNVEMVFQDQKSGRNTLSDLDLSVAHPRIEKNPEVCVFCHGDTRLQYGNAGPHLNFDFAGLWPRFIDGMPSCSKHLDDLQAQVSDRAAAAVQNDDTFRCLDKSLLVTIHPVQPFIPLTRTRAALFDLSRRLNYQHHRRLAYVLRAIPNYEYFKYALVGLALCPKPKHPAEAFYPKALIEKLVKKGDYLPGLREARNLEAFFAQKYMDILDEARKLEWEPKYGDLLSGGIYFNTGNALMCMNDAREEKNLVRDLGLAHATRLEIMVAIDTWVRQRTKGVELDPSLKLFIENDGGTLDGFGMSEIPQDLRTSLYSTNDRSLGVVLGKMLLQLEPANSPLKLYSGHELTPRECGDLRQASLKTLTQLL